MTLLLLSAAFMSASVTWLLIRYNSKVGMDSPDGHRKVQDRPISRLGGFPIYITLMCGCAFSVFHFEDEHFVTKWWPVVLCNSLIFLIGFLDDLKPLGARVKLMGQVGAACILYGAGDSVDVLSNPFGEGSINLGWWSFPITVAWLVSIPNIINLIDGMDGLATGFGLLMSVTLAVVGHFALSPETVLLSVVMSGAMAGFLVFNFPPARIYLGDGGAYLLGFFLASVSLSSSHKGSIIAGLLVMTVALGVPILDTSFAILRRALRGVPIFRADAEHIHHRLILLGFSKTRALVAMYSVCLALSLVGMSILISKGRALPIAALALGLLALGAAKYLGYIKRWSDLRGQLHRVLERRQDMLYAGTWGRVMEWEADRCESAEAFVSLLELATARVGLQTAPLPDLKALSLGLTGGQTCRVYYVDDNGSVEQWRAKGDLFVSALNVALDRWQVLPRLQITRPNSPASSPDESLPSPQKAH